MTNLAALKEMTEQLNLRDAEVIRRKDELERVMNTLPDLFMIFQGQTIVDANFAAERALGYKKEELVGKTVKEMVAPEDKERTLNAHKEREEETTDGAIWFVNRWVTKNGGRVILQWSGWEDEEGKIYAFAKVKTKEQVAKDKIVQEMQRLVERADGLTVIADHSTGKFVMASEAWTEVLGWSKKELTTIPFNTLMHPEDLTRTHASGVLIPSGGGMIVNGLESRYRHKDGSYIKLKWHGFMHGAFSYSTACVVGVINLTGAQANER